MKIFNILALTAALAYTASADKIKASCKFAPAEPEEDDEGIIVGRGLKSRGGRGGRGGRRTGGVFMRQAINTEDDDAEATLVSAFSKNLEADVIYSLMMLDSTGVDQCIDADIDSSIMEFDDLTANARGRVRVRGSEYADFDLSVADHNGQYAALVDVELQEIVQCCVLEVEELIDDNEDG